MKLLIGALAVTLSTQVFAQDLKNKVNCFTNLLNSFGHQEGVPVSINSIYDNHSALLLENNSIYMVSSVEMTEDSYIHVKGGIHHYMHGTINDKDIYITADSYGEILNISYEIQPLIEKYMVPTEVDILEADSEDNIMVLDKVLLITASEIPSFINEMVDEFFTEDKKTEIQKLSNQEFSEILELVTDMQEGTLTAVKSNACQALKGPLKLVIDNSIAELQKIEDLPALLKRYRKE